MNSKLEYIYSLYPNAKCELNYNNKFELLVAIVLSAQTTDIKVNKVTPILFSKYDTIEKLATASPSEVENVLKPLGMYKVKAKNIIALASKIHNAYKDKIPEDQDLLLTLPGVGNKTKNVYLAEGLKVPAFPVDTHILRICKRLGFANINDSADIVTKKMEQIIPSTLQIQMHHSLIFFGRYKCKAIKPLCDDCKLKYSCNPKNY